MKKQKLHLKALQVSSFITKAGSDHLKGGSTEADCPTEDQCTFPLCDLKPATEDTNCDTGCCN